MPAILLQGQVCLGVQQIQELPDAKVLFEGKPLARADGAAIIALQEKPDAAFGRGIEAEF